jgi:hypothetical protein
VGRVEFLPVHWHAGLHEDATGVDRGVVGIRVFRKPVYLSEILTDIQHLGNLIFQEVGMIN